ncbi:MAG: 23S rRNA (pseudouridine(1915)-N(3))-methyltransferase RlmH [Flavobacteriaceae bacterium]|nr:23S rRNA (pseudouridine(1915)-N(3))-methyltransferase RlmH [Flavobacteriaceae bacterium]|tara:strand:- start:1525 stop:1998 length:474 start_codon:yes stop_codon:yes gene_type:complete
MEVILLSVNKTKDDSIEKLISNYSKKINHYVKFSTFEISKIKYTKKNKKEELKNKEGLEIKKFLKNEDICVLLDEKGKNVDSIQFSKLLNNYYCTNKKRLIFVVGGAYGFSDEIYSIFSDKISLSKMTFNHQIIKVFFCEQLYRANTILSNEKYHNN